MQDFLPHSYLDLEPTETDELCEVLVNIPQNLCTFDAWREWPWPDAIDVALRALQLED